MVKMSLGEKIVSLPISITDGSIGTIVIDRETHSAVPGTIPYNSDVIATEFYYFQTKTHVRYITGLTL